MAVFSALATVSLEFSMFAVEGDSSWAAEWGHFRSAILNDSCIRLNGDLSDARYAHEVVQDIYASNGYRTPGGAPITRTEGAH